MVAHKYKEGKWHVEHLFGEKEGINTRYDVCQVCGCTKTLINGIDNEGEFFISIVHYVKRGIMYQKSQEPECTTKKITDATNILRGV
jgi:hypothetical protein